LVLSPVILEPHAIETLGNNGGQNSLTPLLQFSSTSSLIPPSIDIRSTAAFLDTDQLSWLLEYHPISHGRCGSRNSCRRGQRSRGITVVVAPALFISLQSLPQSASACVVYPCWSLVLSGGSQYHGRSVDLIGNTVLYVVLLYPPSIVALPRTFANSTALVSVDQLPLSIGSINSSSRYQQPCSSSPLLTCSLGPQLPRSIEVHRFVVDFFY
jgi:hypothetical protein